VTANVVLFVAISFLRLLYGPVGGTPVSARAAETAKMHKQALDESLSCATGLRPPEGQKPSMPEPEPEQMNHALVWAKDTAAQAHAALTRAPIPPKTRQQGLIGEWRQQVVAAKAAKPNVDAALAATAYSLQAAMDGTQADITSAIIPAVSKAIKSDVHQTFLDTVQRSKVFVVLRQSGVVISRACALDAGEHFISSAHSFRGTANELPPLVKGETFQVVIDSTPYDAKVDTVPELHACPSTGFEDGIIYMSADSSFAPAARLTKDTRGRIIAHTSFGVDAPFTVSIPPGGDCVYVLHGQFDHCKSGNSGAAATQLLPNNAVAHAVHLGVVTGTKGVAATLKEGIAPHVRIVRKSEPGAQAVVRLLEGITQQRHSALTDFWARPKIEASNLKVEE